MKITRLGWAGLELEASGATAVIDLLQDAAPMELYMGVPHTPLPGPSRPGAAVLALVTHLHQDHADPAAIAAALAPGGVLLRPAAAEGEFLEVAATAAAEQGLAELGVAQQVVAPWETAQVGPFRATAIPAVDGFGDPQVSWVVEAAGTRILHAGDTLFHGWWWRARMRLGDVDHAFLPVNGPLVSLPHRQPGSPRPAVMSAAEAAAAAHVLQAGEAIPIHYDAIHNPPIYAQADDPAGTFLREAAALGVPARIVEPGAVVIAGAPTAP
ncbi:MAG TPA: MBL fold metallo-hydrolase [Baekduia sp.]|uniref:MBL fold metallo-hydrolase n=1 Tax=Baekduia sp. TaxID=2600305 RepID=UPI002C3D66FD|nr:MBL fold metallo-hydrolase [Baekduia sp.]HMJ33200.1 MBL fold metallo-hydrolase [Baekduia sp.]